MVVRIATNNALTDDAGTWAQALGAGALFAHPQHGGSAIADLAAVSGRVDAARSDGLERGELLGGCFAQAAIAGDDPFVALGVGDGDGDDLARETAFFGGADGLLLRDQAEEVDIVAGDAAKVCDALGCAELIGHVPRKIVGL